MNEADSSVIVVVPKRLRRLKRNERVRQGDYVEDERRGFELWEGPSGFRADSFIKTIYRKLARQPAVARKTP
ncbi:MAG TPA: hypothetical protein VHG89_10640 [Verrucomicrobiae bacterium]|nr:hypothetical protein [Verrucomicrobiae bacterium]